MDTVKEQDRLEVVFTNGALSKIKEIAAFLSIPDTDLNSVIVKGIQVLSEAKNSGNTFIVIEKKDGKREKLDLLSI